MGFSLSGLLQRGYNDVFHAGQAPAPQQYQAVAQLPNPGQSSPGIFNRIGNTIHNDIIAPVQRDIVNPVAHAVGNVEHAGGNVVNAFSAHSLNNVANSNFNPVNLVENYAVKPGMELGAGIGANLYNHAIAPVFHLPTQQLTNAFPQSAEAQRIAHLTPGQQIANAIQVGSNALPGGGKIVDALAGKAGAKVLGTVGDNVAGRLAGKAASTGLKVGGNAAIGGGMGYGLGAGSTLAQGGSLKQANQAGLANAKIGALLGGGGTAALEAAPHVIQGAKTANAMAHNYGLKPPTNLTPAELSATNKVIHGNPMDVTSQDAQLFHQAQSKLVPPEQVGTAHGMNAASDALNAHAAYNTAVQQRAAQVQAVKQQLAATNKQLVTNQSGKALVSEDGSVIPTFKKLAGKGSQNDPLAALKKEALKYKSADEFVGKDPTAFADLPNYKFNAEQAVKDFKNVEGLVDRVTTQMPDATTAQRVKVYKDTIDAVNKKYGTNLSNDINNILDTTRSASQFPNELMYEAGRKAKTDLYNQAHAEARTAKTSSNFAKGEKVGFAGILAPGDKARTGTFVRQVDKHLAEINYGDHTELNHINNLYKLDQPHAEAKPPTLKQKVAALPQGNKTPVAKMTPVIKKAENDYATGKISAGKLESIRNQEAAATTKSPNSVGNQTKQRGFTTSVKESTNYSKDLKKKISSEYAVVGDKRTIEKTQKFVASKGIEGAHADVLQRLSSSKRPDKQLVNDAGTVMQILDSKGKTAEAQVIHDKLAEHLTNSGQVSQAASLLLRRSPDGIYHKAVGDLKKAGVEVTPSIDDQLKAHRENIRSTMPDTAERELAIQKMKQFVAKNIPSKLHDKVFAVWRAGLLTGPRTVAKILTSHGIQLPLETIKDIPAAAIDRAMSYVTGQRSLVLTGKGFGTGFKEGAKAGFGKNGYLRTGIDQMPGANSIEFHNEVNFKNKILSGYTNGIGRLHGSLYKPFYGAEFKNSLYSQAKAAAATNGLKGQAAKDFVENLVKNPSKDMLDVAKNDAEHTTFQQATELGKGASQIQKIPVVGRYIAPFTRIPSAIASDLIDYSPVGLAKAPIMAIKAARAGEGLTPAVQRQLAQGLGRALTGTAALVPGAVLYKKGMLNFQYPSDPKEQKIWQLEGRTENSVLVGGKWRSLGSLGPLGAVLAMGGGIVAGGPVKGAETAVKTLEDQPYVSGITQAASAIQDPGRYLTNLEKQYAGSVVPTAVAQVASAGDKSARQANTPLDTIKSKIPGVRETLAPKKNAFGQTVQNGETGPGAVIDPFYSSTNFKPDATTQELQRLSNVGQGTIPSTQPTKNSFNGVKTQLTKTQAQDLTAQVGQAVKPLWDKTIASSGYSTLNDDQKHKVLADILSDTSSAVKQRYAANNSLGQYAPGYQGKGSALSAKSAAILQNNFDPSSYTASAASGVSGIAPNLDKQYVSTLTKYGSMNTAQRNKAFATNNSAQYQYDLATYNNKLANGSLSDAQKITAAKSLAKEQVGSNYSQNVRQIYGLSKTEIYQYLTSNPNGNAIAQQLNQYDQALSSAGLIASPKFKYGFAPSTSGGKSGGSNGATPAKIAAAYKSANSDNLKYSKKLYSLSSKAKLGKTVSVKKGSTKVATYKGPSTKGLYKTSVKSKPAFV